MSETPSQLPADIATQVKHVIGDIDEVKALMKKMIEADQPEVALECYNNARLKLSFAQDAARKALAYFGAATMTGMVERQPTMMVLPTREAAAQVGVRRLTPQELRSLHIANDHTVDPDPDPEQSEQLTLEVSR